MWRNSNWSSLSLFWLLLWTLLYKSMFLDHLIVLDLVDTQNPILCILSYMQAHMYSSGHEEDSAELRRGPWTLEEDTMLSHYIAHNGEGRWNMLAKCAGLKRTGKSCRLRWLNYLKPDIKRGNLTPQEQLLILELHAKWGNRWSKIAQHLPGRTDNEIKNYWRTRVQRQARQLNIESNSTRFLEAIRCFWVPRLLQKMEQSSSSSSPSSSTSSATTTPAMNSQNSVSAMAGPAQHLPPPCPLPFPPPSTPIYSFMESSSSANSLSVASSETSQQPDISEQPPSPFHGFGTTVYNDTPILSDSYYVNTSSFDMEGLDLGPMVEPNDNISQLECQISGGDWAMNNMGDGLWNMDEMWQLRELENMGM